MLRCPIDIGLISTIRTGRCGRIYFFPLLIIVAKMVSKYRVCVCSLSFFTNIIVCPQENAGLRPSRTLSKNLHTQPFRTTLAQPQKVPTLTPTSTPFRMFFRCIVRVANANVMASGTCKDMTSPWVPNAASCVAKRV